ncbi:single-stranded-DNA-specific exonuclease RecJ [Vitiosangium sp. GDMCC 1.1324]|uniref:single-stranded-DNA-specific exonuclease RecJ n=1 Tax=Vitiosangium sp. (strain GDMCC 1.1324) TaxID=2138576 RepID=UPI000D3CF574|nr:single-stranded-DNA-specific exonuclease RecJ [Vitiosangium sp. GDMCC 1.1324]PTL76194.1 single-stranded-DNA-specific exonuclease RecJ [Vitiosangium sp. GDMCC 1.1324]
MRWLMPEVPQEQAASLAAELGLHPLSARVLVHRGLSNPEAASAFLSDRLADLPDPFRMKGMAAAVERLFRAIRQKEPITLYGDYDVDGVCSTSLLCLFLRELGARPATYIPHRLDEGYGLNVQAVEKIAADGTRVLVTLDCGVTSVAEISRAKELGLDVVVVDHHTVPPTLPPAVAVLNPHQPGCEYPTKHLCAAGVAFNLCMGLRKKLREDGWFATRKEPNLKALMDLVAMATVADVVPLTGANRILVHHGLQELSAGRRYGVRALKEVAGLDADSPVTAGQVGFRLGPRINAAGRLHDASLGLQLLCSETLDAARSLAQVLDRANAERQGIESSILTEALAQAQERAEHVRGFVLYSEGWHPGVIGIVASRVVERFHRPTVMVGVKDGVGKGSARSIEGFHLYDALSGCADLLARFGGHKHAAGLTIEAKNLPALRESFERIAKQRLTPEDLVPRCKVDAVVGVSELDERAVEALQRLGPFGQGNPEPVLVLRHQVARPRVLASKSGGGAGHLKLALVDAPAVDAIGFGMADRLALTEGPVDLAFQASFDTFRGQRRLSLKLKDLRAAA